MMSARPPQRTPPLRQRGAAAVEFAMTAIVWVAMTIAVIEMGRAMYIYTALREAAHVGARNAVVCGVSVADTRSALQKFLPLVDATDTTKVIISYPGTPCTADSCTPLTLSIVGFQFNPIMVPFNITFPRIDVSLPIETRSSAGQAVDCSL